MSAKNNTKSTINVSAYIVGLQNRTRVQTKGTCRELEKLAGMLYWTTKSAALKPFAHLTYAQLTADALKSLLAEAGVDIPAKAKKDVLVKALGNIPVSALRPLLLRDVIPSISMSWESVEILFGISKAMRRELADTCPWLVLRWESCKYGTYPVFSAGKVMEAAWSVKQVKESFLLQVAERISAEAKAKKAAIAHQKRLVQLKEDVLSSIRENAEYSDDVRQAALKYVTELALIPGIKREADEFIRWYQEKAAAIAQTDDAVLSRLLSEVKPGRTVQAVVKTYEYCLANPGYHEVDAFKNVTILMQQRGYIDMAKAGELRAAKQAEAEKAEREALMKTLVNVASLATILQQMDSVFVVNPNGKGFSYSQSVDSSLLPICQYFLARAKKAADTQKQFKKGTPAQMVHYDSIIREGVAKMLKESPITESSIFSVGDRVRFEDKEGTVTKVMHSLWVVVNVADVAYIRSDRQLNAA
jgi:hypothetical protein